MNIAIQLAPVLPMKRNTLNLIIDLVTTVIVLGLVVTGLLLEFVLPPGAGRQGLMLLGWDRHAWGDVHFWLSIAALGLVIIHVALHWQWICTSMLRMFTGPGHGAPSGLKRHVAGAAAVAVLAILIGGLLWLANAAVVADAGAVRAHSREHADPASVDGPAVRGAMTLRQVAQTSNLSIDALIDKLDLPDDVDLDTPLRDLFDQHGFRMPEVRRAVADLQD